MGEGTHRAMGYSVSVLFRERQRRLAKGLRVLYSESEMGAMLAGTHLEGNVTLQEAYAAGVMPVAAIVGLSRLGTMLVSFVRRDPCRLLPLWDASPARFVVEYARWTGVGGFRAAVGSADTSYYSIYSANTDARVFPDPLTFDPSRDLGQTLSWNMLEEEYQASTAGGAAGHGGATTMRRPCPARGFSVRALTALVGPLVSTFERSSCNQGLRVFHGVKFRAEIVPVLNGTASLEVPYPKHETRNPKLEIQSPKPEIRNPKPESRISKPESQTRNSTSLHLTTCTLHPAPYILNPEPHTLQTTHHTLIHAPWTLSAEP